MYLQKFIHFLAADGICWVNEFLIESFGMSLRKLSNLI